jgi:ABC-type multidrug transport system fused ATPase/permease subunit
VAIARAVIRKPKILILDEATSALDEKSQALVQTALRNVMKGRTSIVIAHRLTTVERCSRVVVVEGGVVAESGTFQQLMANEDGHFASLSKGMRKVEKKEEKERAS